MEINKAEKALVLKALYSSEEYLQKPWLSEKLIRSGLSQQLAKALRVIQSWERLHKVYFPNASYLFDSVLPLLMKARIIGSRSDEKTLRTMADKLVTAARGGKNPRDAKKYLDKIAETYQLSPRVVTDVLEILFPK